MRKPSLFRVAAKAMFCRTWCNFSFSSACVVLWRWCSNSLALRSGGDGPSTLTVCGVGCFRTGLGVCFILFLCFFVCSFACSSVGSMCCTCCFFEYMIMLKLVTSYSYSIPSHVFDLTDISLFVALLEVAENIRRKHLAARHGLSTVVLCNISYPNTGCATCKDQSSLYQPFLGKY